MTKGLLNIFAASSLLAMFSSCGEFYRGSQKTPEPSTNTPQVNEDNSPAEVPMRISSIAYTPYENLPTRPACGSDLGTFKEYESRPPHILRGINCNTVGFITIKFLTESGKTYYVQQRNELDVIPPRTENAAYGRPFQYVSLGITGDGTEKAFQHGVYSNVGAYRLVATSP